MINPPCGFNWLWLLERTLTKTSMQLKPHTVFASSEPQYIAPKAENNLLVLFQLHSANERSATPILDAISELGRAVYVANALFFVSSTLSAQQAMQKLGPLMQHGDSLFIADTRNNSASWIGLSTESAQALKKQWVL